MINLKKVIEELENKSNETKNFIFDLLNACREGQVRLIREKHDNSSIISVYLSIGSFEKYVGKYCPQMTSGSFYSAGSLYVGDEILKDYLFVDDNKIPVSYNMLVENGAHLGQLMSQ